MKPHQALSAWYAKKSRKLPWRATRDPYAIWVSEVMLQQTQVKTVIPYYEKFLRQFPTVESLAKSPIDEVLRHWSGLGYYRRAHLLHQGALWILEKHRGKFPHSVVELKAVPGIGPYTAGAVLSIAFDIPTPIVDGNVIRVLSRYFGIKRSIQERSTMITIWEESERWVLSSQSPRIFNQALMELGALICTKGQPSCEQCPIQAGCAAFLRQMTHAIPNIPKRPQKTKLIWVCPVIKKGEDFLFLKSEGQRWWKGLWCFPHTELASLSQISGQLKKTQRQFKTQDPVAIGKFKHTVTHHELHVYPYLFEQARLPATHKNSDEAQFFSNEDIESLALSSLTRKILKYIPGPLVQ